MAERPFILVIDDNEQVLELLDSALSLEYRVYVLANPYQIMEFIQLRRPDLVLTDLGLPVHSGSDLIKTIRSDPSFNNMPIIVMSAYANMMKLVPPGLVQGFLAKPFSMADLFQLISQLLNQPRVAETTLPSNPASRS